MPSGRGKRPEPCSNDDCGSRRFHVGDDGYTYCDRGHQQSERGTVVTEDTGELIIHGRTSKRKSESDAESTASRVSGFSGSRAFEHYLLCLQLVLRKQIRWLIDVQKLPEELENLVRDLWAFRLQSIQYRASANSETETEAQSQSQSQVFTSSQSEGESSQQSSASRRDRDRKGVRRGAPTLPDTICLFYTASLLLRIPITIADFHKWAQDGEFLFYRASREVPLQMREKLPATYQDLLEPHELGSPTKLHQGTLKLLETLTTSGMAFPGLNYPLVLYRWIRALGLPIEIFAATQRLGRLLNVDFNYALAEQVTDKRVRMLRYPEARLMALVIIATKLLYPFDDADVLRSAISSSDPSALRMDWDAWRTHYNPENSASDEEDHALSFQDATSLKEQEAVSLSDEKLDAYLDFYSSTFASEDIRSHGEAGKEADFRRALFGMFPSAGNQTAATNGEPAAQSHDTEDTHLQHTQSRLQPRPLTSSSQSTQAYTASGAMGSAYRRFRSVDELNEVAKEGNTAEAAFYELASKLAGVELDEMVRGVFVLERRMQTREEGLRKGGMG